MPSVLQVLQQVDKPVDMQAVRKRAEEPERARADCTRADCTRAEPVRAEEPQEPEAEVRAGADKPEAGEPQRAGEQAAEPEWAGEQAEEPEWAGKRAGAEADNTEAGEPQEPESREPAVRSQREPAVCMCRLHRLEAVFHNFHRT